MSCVRVMISGQRKLFHDQMNDNTTFVATAAVDSGSMTRSRMRRSPNPSIRAASISDRGTASKLALNTKMQTIVDSSGSARPR